MGIRRYLNFDLLLEQVGDGRYRARVTEFPLDGTPRVQFQSSSDLLLALAQSAASNTSALMLARSSSNLRPRPTPRGEVFRVETSRLEPGAGTIADLSPQWTAALHGA
jgi:hypothetical protein